MKTILVLAGMLVLASPAMGQPVTVTAGDTIRLNGVIFHLWGIDAPDVKQTCPDGWPAGTEAKHALEALIAERKVVCEDRGTGRDGPRMGLCKGDGQDLSAAMVRKGMAWAFRRDSHDYVVQEGEAMAANLGVHSHDCQLSWEWRAEHK